MFVCADLTSDLTSGTPHPSLSLPPSCSRSPSTHLILGTSQLFKSREFQVEGAIFFSVVVVVVGLKWDFSDSINIPGVFIGSVSVQWREMGVRRTWTDWRP